MALNKWQTCQRSLTCPSTPTAVHAPKEVPVPATLVTPLGSLTPPLLKKSSPLKALKRLREHRTKFNDARKTLIPVARYKGREAVLSLDPNIILE